MTEALYITAILWTLDAAMRLVETFDGAATARRRLRLGLELGLAMAAALLLRQVISAFLAVLALWFLALAWRRGGGTASDARPAGRRCAGRAPGVPALRRA